ncbi:MAG: N-acetylneuraminate synthase family protein, partial [Phycisphaerae bacterium]
LHCISSYPTRPEDANLRRIGTLAARYGVPTGFSDHTMGIETGAMAAAAGACLLEKHFTLSRAQHGPDHSFSLEPDGLAAYVRQVRLAEQVLGQGQLGMSPCEQEVRRLGRSSVVAAQDIAAGQRIGLGMLTVKRPGGGIEPSRLYELVGRTAVVDIPAEAQVRWEMVN